MITNFFIPELNNHDVQELWFQQDGATCHTARASIDLLKDTLGDRLISRFGPVNWPPRSCDLTPLDYFLWGYVKSLVYANKPETLDHLEDNIRRVIADIRPQMLEKVIENWTSRLDYIRACRGSPMPEIILEILVQSNKVICERRDDFNRPLTRTSKHHLLRLLPSAGSKHPPSLSFLLCPLRGVNICFPRGSGWYSCISRFILPAMGKDSSGQVVAGLVEGGHASTLQLTAAGCTCGDRFHKKETDPKCEILRCSYAALCLLEATRGLLAMDLLIL
ncbi:uncharacterized protein TNCV_1903451 [Trichonephila clavipes]|nr:uncharacterized protein TNCV_1903451 [Trichonephila clavipes]